MAEPLSSLAGVKAGTMLGIGAGASVASLIIQGPWYVRLVAGVSGALCAFFVTPILSPIALRFIVIAYDAIGVPAEHLPVDSVAGFVGFAAGLTGIDICRWIIDRTKGGLKLARFPSWMWPPRQPPNQPPGP